MADYDISEAFRKIELEMIASMKRNWVKHNLDEKTEGFTWSRWQAEQLKGLEDYRKKNPKKFSGQFDVINENYLNELTGQHETNFFGINERRMNALIESSMGDLKTAEYAMLRKTNDEYRKIIFNSQVYLNSGAGSLNKAIDMASDDFLKRGINCVVYKNGRQVNIADYARMSLRTSSTRAQLYAGGARRDELGVHTVKVSSYGMCSPTCLPWQGRVYVDNVYSGGTAEEAERLHLPLLSTAIEGGLFHPNCKHHISTYYPGDQNEDSGDPRDKNDQKYLKKWENSPDEIEHMRLQSQIQQQKRIAAGSMEQAKINQAQNNVGQLEKQDDSLSLNSQTSSLTHIYEDITDSFIEENKPDGSKPIFENGYDLSAREHIHDIKIANLTTRNFGGKLVGRKEANKKGVHTSDYIWNDKLWENKKISSKSSVKNQIIKGVKQIKENPGGFMLDASSFNKDISNNEIIGYVKDRLRQDVNFNCKVIIYRNDQVMIVLKHKIKR